MDRKHQQRLCNKKSIDVECMSQDEEDAELTYPKKDEDSTISIHSGICISVWYRNMDLDIISNKATRRLLHENVEDGIKYDLESGMLGALLKFRQRCSRKECILQATASINVKKLQANWCFRNHLKEDP